MTFECFCNMDGLSHDAQLRSRRTRNEEERRHHERDLARCASRRLRPCTPARLSTGLGKKKQGAAERRRLQRRRLEILSSRRPPYFLVPCSHPRAFPPLDDYRSLCEHHLSFYERIRGAQIPGSVAVVNQQPPRNQELREAERETSLQSRLQSALSDAVQTLSHLLNFAIGRALHAVRRIFLYR
ncbi:uncharacterized protein LOC144125180 [Amblyomma americanum]